jgi:hypothetical protein
LFDIRARANALQVEFVNRCFISASAPASSPVHPIPPSSSDRDAAWLERTKVCGDLVGSISRHLKQNAEWQTELLDESEKPLF